MANTLGGRVVGNSGGPTASGTNTANVSNREDLANFISMITRDETPFLSSIGKTKATAIYHEWQTDSLQAPGNSRIPEGQDYLNVGVTGAQTPAVGGNFNIAGPNRTRLGAYTQINGKTMSISGTRRAIDQAGIADEYAYQLKKRGTEMRRDIEMDLINSSNVSGAFGDQNGNARTTGGYMAWINGEVSSTGHNQGNVVYAGTVAASASATAAGRVAAASQGEGTATWVPASTVANRGVLSLSDIDQSMQNIYENGGKASRVMLSPKLRRDFSDLMVQDAGVRRNIDMDGKLRQSVDVYMSDFGDLMVVPNYIMGLESASAGTNTGATGNTSYQDAAALIYDPQWFAIATLRPLQEVDVGQQGDSTVGMMVEEFALECKNPAGCGAIYNLR